MKTDHLYVKRSYPLVWLSVVSMLASAGLEAMNGLSGWGWIVCPAFCICYTAVLGGRIKKLWLLTCCLAAAGAAVWGQNLSLILAAAGLLLLYPAVRVHNDGKYHPTWGDRVNGRRIRSAPAMEQITACFMPNRNGANNLFAESVEITELERYVRRKRRKGLKQFGMRPM